MSIPYPKLREYHRRGRGKKYHGMLFSKQNIGVATHQSSRNSCVSDLVTQAQEEMRLG